MSIVFVYIFSYFDWRLLHDFVVKNKTSVAMSKAGYRYGYCEFEHQLGQHSDRRPTKFKKTSVIRLIYELTSYNEKHTVAWKHCCVGYWCAKQLVRLANRLGMNANKIVENVLIKKYRFTGTNSFNGSVNLKTVLHHL